MSVMQVREVRVAMDQRRVAVPMRMRLTRGIARCMAVVMMIVMTMQVLMLKRLMRVLMIMPLYDVKIDS